MKKVLAFTLSLILVVTLLPEAMIVADDTDENTIKVEGKAGKDYVAGEVLVQVKDGAGKLVGKKASAKVEGVKSEINGEEFKVKEDIGEAIESMDDKSNNDEVVLVKGDDTEDLINALDEDPNVVSAQPNYIYNVQNYDGGNNEPGIDYQWGLKNSYDYTGEGIDTGASDMWSHHSTGEEVVIAVADTGVDYNHKDLKNMMWQGGLDYPELAGFGGSEYGVNASDEGKSDEVMDAYYGHGTHCAGIIAAQYNEEGVAGVFNDVKIMAVKLAEGANMNSSAIYEGYRYMKTAKEAGVNLVAINDSWGSSSQFVTCDDLFRKAVDELGRLGTVSVIAAGNHDEYKDLKRSDYFKSDYILRVGACESSGKAADFSDFGQDTVDVFAPGVNILSTMSGASDTLKMKGQYLPWIQDDSASYAYNDFKTHNDEVDLSGTYKNSGNTYYATESEKGYADDKAVKITVPTLYSSNRYTVTAKIKVNKSEFNEDEKAYFACALGFDNVNVSSGITATFYPQRVSSSRNKKIEKINDYNYKVLSDEFSGSDIINSIDDDGYLVMKIDIDLSQEIVSANANVRVDNIGVGCETSEYGYSDGTSMATPFVTGMVGSLAYRYPDASSDEIVAMVKGSALKYDDENSKVEGLCNTDGYANLQGYVSKDNIRPVINSLNVEGNTVTLNGFFFGDNPGSVTIKSEIDAEINSWSDNEIKFKFTDEMQTSLKRRVEVKNATTNLYGRNFFVLGSDMTGYVPIKSPDEKNDVNSTVMCANENVILAAFVRAGSETLTLKTYDEEHNDWSLLENPFSEDNNDYLSCTASEIHNCIKLAASENYIYMLYPHDEEEDEDSDLVTETQMILATLDTRSMKWINAVDVSEYADEFSMLAYYDGDLLIMGGKKENNSIKLAVNKIYPNTGRCCGNLPSLPNNIGCLGNVVVNGDDLYIINSFKVSGTASDPADYSYSAVDPYMFDGTEWNRLASSPMQTNEHWFSQTITDSAFACGDGYVYVGNLDFLDDPDLEYHPIDTYKYSKTDDSFYSDENLRFNFSKTVAIGATANERYGFVLGVVDTSDEIRAAKVDFEDNPYGIKAPQMPESDPELDPEEPTTLAPTTEVPESTTVPETTKAPPATKAPTTRNKKPNAVKVKKAYKKKKSKKLSLKIKKNKNTKGYQVKVFKTKKNAKKVKKALITKTYKKYKKTFSIKSKKLKKKKKLYVRVRAYNFIYGRKGKKQYGKWSKIKKVKVK